MLSPDAHQSKSLLDTMNRYSELFNYVSQAYFENDDIKPRNLYYWRVDYWYDNFYRELRDKFKDINSNFIQIVFGKVSKAYRKNRPSEAYKLSGATHYNKYLLSIKCISPLPFNIGTITISTLTGRQQLYFKFEEAERNDLLYIALNGKKYREYELLYQEEKFYMSTTIKEEPANLLIPILIPDDQYSHNSQLVF